MGRRQRGVIECSVRATHKTGVEMEALTGASVAALTIYDMCKALTHGIAIREVVLLAKAGGKRDLRSARREDRMTIEVTARYFAAFRERAGRDTERVSTQARTAADLYGELAQSARIRRFDDALQSRVNDELEDWNVALSPGDEVLFFPPVAGG